MNRQHHIGLVGCGEWGRYILRDLLNLGCKVTVVARSDQSKKRALAGGASDIVSHIDDLPKVDGIVVAVLTVSHAEVVEALLHRQVPIFVEKPLTDDPVSAYRLVKKAPDRIFVMDKWRYHPGVEMLAEIARTEKLGPVLGLRTIRVGWGNPHADVDGIWMLAPHDLSISLEILATILKPRHAISEKIDEVPMGLIGILGENPWFIFEVSIRSHIRCREVQLHCKEGIAILSDGYSNHIQIIRGYPPPNQMTSTPIPELHPLSTEFPLLRELKAFLQHLDGGPPPRSSAVEGAMIVQTIADLRKLAGLNICSKMRC